MLLQFSFSGLFDSFLLESLILIAAAFLLGYFIRGSASKSKEKKPIKEKEERNPYEQQLKNKGPERPSTLPAMHAEPKSGVIAGG